MKNSWPMVPLREIATPTSRSVAVEPGNSYRTIGVKWWGQGAYERQTIDGSQTAAKTLSLVRKDDLIINKIWVRHGSTAIAGDDVDGCAASGEFPTFTLDRTRVESRWLHWLTKTRPFWGKCDGLSRGTSGKNRIKPELFLTIDVPLPPLAEQRRIVARIESLAAKIAEAASLHATITEECEQLCRAPLFDSATPPTPIRMNELVDRRPLDVTVKATQNYDFAGIYCFGGGMFKSARKSGIDFAYRQLTTVHVDDFVYPKLMAWEGALTIVPPECDGLVVSPEFPVFRVRTDRVLPEVLDVYFKTPAIWPTLSGSSIGTNVRRRRLNPDDFLDIEFPLPSMPVQRAIRSCRQRTNALKQLQSQSAAELEALLPSILDRAFRGEL